MCPPHQNISYGYASYRQNGLNASLCPEEEPLWSKGWIPPTPQDHKQQQHPYQGHGIWQTLQAIGPDQCIGWAFTLDATPSTYDARSQAWVFGLCVHTQTMGQLRRLGAITGIPTGAQTKPRALFGGIGQTHHNPRQGHHPAQFRLGSLAQEPAPASIPRPYMDNITNQERKRITVLYISRNTKTPDAPGNEPQLRRRQRDAALTAWERANAMRDRKLTEWQQTLDQDHALIYKQTCCPEAREDL